MGTQSWLPLPPLDPQRGVTLSVTIAMVSRLVAKDIILDKLVKIC